MGTARAGRRIPAAAAQRLVLISRPTPYLLQRSTEWVFDEIRFAAKDGLVDLRDTLWAQLERDGESRLLQRSGSF